MGKVFSAELRNMIVGLHLDGGRPIKALSEEYGISPSTIGRWVIYYKNKGLLETEKLSKGVPFDSMFIHIQSTMKHHCLQ